MPPSRRGSPATAASEVARRRGTLPVAAGAAQDAAADPLVGEMGDLLAQLQQRAQASRQAAPNEPDHETYTGRRAAHFNAMVDLIGRLDRQGCIVLGEQEMRDLHALEHAAWQLQQHAQRQWRPAPQFQELKDRLLRYITGQPADEDPGDVLDHCVHDLLRNYECGLAEGRARQALNRLLQKHLPALVDQVQDTDSLLQMAQDLTMPLRRIAERQDAQASPSLVHAQVSALRSIQQDVRLAAAESALQKDLLQTLGLAASILGKHKVHGLRGGLNHIWRSTMGASSVQRLGGDGRPRAEQVLASLEQHFGEFFSVTTGNGEGPGMTLKDDAPGSLSSADFERVLSHLLQVPRPRLIGRVVGRAVAVSPDYERVQVAGRDTVHLGAPALARLSEAAGAGTGPAATPQERASVQGLLHGVALAALKHARSLAGDGRDMLATVQRVFGGLLHIDHDPQTGRIGVTPHRHWADRHPDALVLHLNRVLRASHAEGDQAAHDALAGVLQDHVHLEPIRGGPAEALQVSLRGADGLPATPPRQRLAGAAKQALQAAELAVLKLSLVRSFRGLIDARLASGDDGVPWHHGLRQAKDELLDRSFEALMACTGPGEMRDCVARAQREHDQLWRDDWKRPHGGRTAALLHDLRLAIERF